MGAEPGQVASTLRAAAAGGAADRAGPVERHHGADLGPPGNADERLTLPYACEGSGGTASGLSLRCMECCECANAARRAGWGRVARTNDGADGEISVDYGGSVKRVKRNGIPLAALHQPHHVQQPLRAMNVGLDTLRWLANMAI